MSAEPTEDALTAYVADFITSTKYTDVPPEALPLGKKSILDALACGIGGSVAKSSTIILNYLETFGPLSGNATVIGTARKLPPRFAALVNGNAMHADDFDDTFEAATPNYQGGHPTVPVLAAALAVGEELGSNGRDMLAAYFVGVEVCCRVIDAMDVPGGARGRHTTASGGCLGAAAAVANLRRLPMDGVRRVLGLAAARAAGLHQSFGTMAKAFQVGCAAESAVVAADLIHLGFTASTTILDGPGGFFESESGGRATHRIADRLGRPWAFLEQEREGVRLKPWPSGSLTHPGMTLALDLIEKNDIRPQNVEHVVVRMSEGTNATLLHHHPRTALQAKFSYEFCLAAMFVERNLGLRHFTDAFVNQPEVQRLIQAIVCETFTDEQATSEGYTPQTTFLSIQLNDGRSITGRLDRGKGSFTLPMTNEEVEAKLMEGAKFARWPATKVAELVAAVTHLEQAQDLSALMISVSRSG